MCFAKAIYNDLELDPSASILDVVINFRRLDLRCDVCSIICKGRVAVTDLCAKSSMRWDLQMLSAVTTVQQRSHFVVR
jgi:hypothetical protein